jgi:hypothetical protein
MSVKIIKHFIEPNDAAIPASGFRGPGSQEVARRNDILKLIPRGGVGAELGVFCGDLSAALIEKAKPTCLYLVDPWWKIYGSFYPSWGAYTDFGKLTTGGAYALTISKIENIASDTEVHIHDDFSTDWLKTIPDGHLDWVYVDSTHAFDQTLDELHLLRKKLKKTGLIFGDDFQSDEKHPHHGVYRAVQTFVREAPYELFYADMNLQWALRPAPESTSRLSLWLSKFKVASAT